MPPWEKAFINCSLSHGPDASSATIMNHTRIVKELGELFQGLPALLPDPALPFVLSDLRRWGWGQVPELQTGTQTTCPQEGKLSH